MPGPQPLGELTEGVGRLGVVVGTLPRVDGFDVVLDVGASVVVGAADVDVGWSRVVVVGVGVCVGVVVRGAGAVVVTGAGMLVPLVEVAGASGLTSRYSAKIAT